MPQQQNTFPKLHNAAWPGLVGKGPDSEPPIDLDTMISLTASATANGQKFDGMDLFLFDPHVSIDADDDAIERFLEFFFARILPLGTVAVPPYTAPCDSGAI